MTYAYNTIQEVINDFTVCVENEWGAMFDQGDVLVNALTDESIAHLYPDCTDYDAARTSLKVQCADGTDKSIRTIENRIQVAKTFAPDERAADRSWSIHLLCAMQDDPHFWLEYAVAQNITSFRKLKMAIQAGAGDAAKDVERPVYAVDSQSARVLTCAGRVLALELDEEPRLKPGTAVVITVMIP